MTEYSSGNEAKVAGRPRLSAADTLKVESGRGDSLCDERGKTPTGRLGRQSKACAKTHCDETINPPGDVDEPQS